MSEGSSAVEVDGGPFEVLCVATYDIPLRGLFHIDGVRPKPGDWVLAANQNKPKENGVYAAAEGDWHRDRCDLEFVKSHKRGVCWGAAGWRRWFKGGPWFIVLLREEAADVCAAPPANAGCFLTRDS